MLGAAVRVARNMAGARSGVAKSGLARQRKLGTAVFSGARAAFGGFARVLHLLWLQITGVFFFIFAIGFAAAAVRQYRAWSTTHTDGAKLALVIGFTVLFAWFGASSFWRAARKQKR